MRGRQVSHYRITGTLGLGGMGVVYEAQDVDAPRLVALKFLADELALDADAVRRFRRESEILAQLHHPGICVVLEVLEHDGRVCMAMERVDGVSLNRWASIRRPDESSAIAIAAQIVDALRAAHQAGVVHRDIKPGNIIVDKAGRATVLDFGLARRYVDRETGEDVRYGSTLVGRPQGTVSYMAPERILQFAFDPRSDLFSLGVVLYELVAGTLPFRGDSPGDIVTAIMEHAPEPLRRAAPGTSVDLERLVERLLAKQPEHRVQSAGELLDTLAHLGARKRGFFRR